MYAGLEYLKNQNATPIITSDGAMNFRLMKLMLMMAIKAEIGPSIASVKE